MFHPKNDCHEVRFSEQSELKFKTKTLLKAGLRQSFSTCVYCMLLRFQNYYTGLSQPS